MKKNIFLLLVLIIIMTTTCALGATFSDVKGTDYQESVELLTELKIVKGKSSTSFAPNDIVKRSEMAKMLVIALGRDADAQKAMGTTKFPDVAKDYWATGYINVATELGLIKGYPDGTFAPEDTVSYVEAVAMVLRALNYEDVDKLSWPDGYMEKATSISLTKGFTITNNNEGAIRGNISILICNTLKSNVREITGSNANGMIYGNGDTLINKYFSNYKYVANGEVTDIDVTNKKITVTDSNKKKYTFKYTSKDIYELYGKDITILYDSENEAVKTLDIASNNKTIHGDISEIKNKKLYIGKKEYAVPSSSKIKLIGVSSINDADEVYITTKDGTVTHMVGIGEEKVYFGIASAKSYKSGTNYKVSLYDLDDEKETFVLEDDDISIAKGEVVIYTLNDDDELVVKYHIDEDDAYTVQKVSKTSIKLKNKGTYTLSTDDMIIVVCDGYISEKNYATSIEVDDVAYVIELADSKVVIGFVEEDDDDDDDDDGDDVASATKTVAKKRLNAAITAANKKKETLYTVATYEKMKLKLEAAENVNQSTASISTMDKASLALENAISNLKSATSTDKNIRKELTTFDEKIAEAKAIKESDYTSDSYQALTTALKTAESFNRTTATVAKVQEATKKLQTALDGLKNIATEAEISEIKKGMNDLIAKAEVKLNSSNKDKWSKDSKEDLEKALEAAKNANYDTMTIQKLTSINNNLYTALDDLESVHKARFDEAVKSYEKAIANFEKLNENDYTESSWNDVEDVIIDIDSYKDAEESKKAEYDYANNILAIEEAQTELEKAIDNLIKTKEYRAKESLKDTIKDAKKIKEEDWNAEIQGKTFAEFEAMIENAEKVLEDSTATESEIKTTDEGLKEYIY